MNAAFSLFSRYKSWTSPRSWLEEKAESFGLTSFHIVLVLLIALPSQSSRLCRNDSALWLCCARCERPVWRSCNAASVLKSDDRSGQRATYSRDVTVAAKRLLSGCRARLRQQYSGHDQPTCSAPGNGQRASRAAAAPRQMRSTAYGKGVNPKATGTADRFARKTANREGFAGFSKFWGCVENGGRPWNRTRRESPRGSYSPLPHLAA